MAEEKKIRETKDALPTEGFIKPKVKQAVIESEDVQTPARLEKTNRGFRVKVAGLRGQYQNIRFNDDFIAERVDQSHLVALQSHFGESNVELLEDTQVDE